MYPWHRLPQKSMLPGLKGYWWTFGVATIDVKKIKQLSTLPDLLEDPSVLGLLHVEVQQSLIAAMMVHQRWYGINQDFLVRAFGI